jgi:hypothetical protein
VRDAVIAGGMRVRLRKQIWGGRAGPSVAASIFGSAKISDVE